VHFQGLNLELYLGKVVILLLEMDVTLLLIGLFYLLTLFTVFSLHNRLFLCNLILHLQNVPLGLLNQSIAFL
jgi:hypothetical protein